MWIFSAVASAIAAGILFILATVGVAVALVVFFVLFVVFGLIMGYRLRKGATTFESNGTRVVFYSNIPGAADAARQRMTKKAEQDTDVYELSPEDYSVENIPEDKTQHRAIEGKTPGTR